MKTYKELNQIDEAVDAPFIKKAIRSVGDAMSALGKVKDPRKQDVMDDLEKAREDLDKMQQGA